MADFISQRNALNTTRADQESGQLDLSAIKARITLLKQEEFRLKRSLNPENAQNNERLAELEERIGSLEGQVEEMQSALDGLSGKLQELYDGWIEVDSLTDPRMMLEEHFENRTPFLLFPTRMETRFKTAVNPETGDEIPQLWVRIYPDTCMVDSFDPQLSAQEIRNAARFWAEYHAAGQIVDETNPDPKTLDLQKAAWAFLVNLEGAGRAAWIAHAEEALPLAGSIFPLRDSNETVILAIATDDASIVGNQAAIFDFFSDLWKAGADEEKKASVKSAFPDADEVIEKFLPVNFDDPLPAGLARDEADLKIALVLMPEALESTGKTHAWSRAARVSIIPERFVLLGYKGEELLINELGKPIPSPLQVGFDPSAAEENNFSPTESGDLNIPKELKWVIDFDEAVEKGMGFRINLTEATMGGVDRLLCLGVRLSADETETGGQQLLTELFEHHFHSDKGFSIVPQGTPTNNTEEKRSGFTDVDDPNETFELYFRQQPAYDAQPDWLDKADGQWLGEWLGLDDALFRKTLHAGRLDQADVMNMNLALWPGTLGYAMEAMMSPVFPEHVIEATRQFFGMFVTGRGSLPAVRIASQPYGILPAAAFGRLEWMDPRRLVTDFDRRGAITFGGSQHLEARFVHGLHQLLTRIESDWRQQLVPQVPHASADNPQDTHQHLLDIVGLHPNSVEFYFRYMQTLDLLYSYASLAFPFGDVQKGFDKMEFGAAFRLLEELGYEHDVEDPFPLLSKLYGLDLNWQHKVIIDTVPLSEFDPIRSYTADNCNYIEALLDAASKSMDALRKNEELSESPTALLFKLLKFALEQGFFETAVRLHQGAEILSAQQATALRMEKPFLHMNWQGEMVESRYALLYKEDDRIATGVTVADHITSLVANIEDLKVISPVHYQQIAALDRLKGASTARLERAFVEHLDSCSYRLDAWQQGILRLQLTEMRNNHSRSTEEEQPLEPKKGIYIGAFGWLENVRPEEQKILTPVPVPEELKEDFTESYVSDSANAGYIHAPSVNQAVTAAVLRNAFLTNGKADDNSELAVNLSSERIRLALSVIEGIQNGQSLAALLGYKFERLLHDQIALKDKKIDTYIYALRKQFPLNADQIADTKVENDPSVDPDNIPISAIEARNVVHGTRLLAHIRKQTKVNQSYPYGFPVTKLPLADGAIAKAIDDAVDHIKNIEDAVADLAMAESVHQVAMGNYDRATGVLESYSTGSYPQMPDVIRTPRSGPSLSHRVGIQMTFVPSVPFDATHPRKSTEPSINQWLGAMLPAMDKLVCHVKYIDRSDASLKREPVSMQDLQIEPIDLLYLFSATSDANLAAIDEHVLHFVYSNKTPMLDTEIEIEYVPRPQDATHFSLFEVMSLIKSIRSLVLESTHLKPTDIYRSSEASAKFEPAITLDKSRAEELISGLNTLLDVPFTVNVRNVLNGLPVEPTLAEKETIRHKVDQYLLAVFTEMERLRRFGLPQSGSGHLYQRRAELIDALQGKVREVIERLDARRVEYEELFAVFVDTAPDAVEQLQRLEALVSTQYSDLDAINEAGVVAKKTLFDGKLLSLSGVLNPSTISGIFILLDNIRSNTTDLGDYDLEAFDLSEIEDEIVRFVLNDLKPLAQGAYDLGKERTAKAADLLTDLSTKGAQAQVDLIQQATQSILGDEFKLAPRYDLDLQQAFEVNNAWNSADLLDYLKNVHTPNFLDPVEDWMHGIARVREKMHHAENCIFLRDALGLDTDQLTLHPIQLPYKDEEYHWLAMPFPEQVSFDDGDVLLYTALTSSAAPAPGYACGFLIDEWTEVIPTESETTGLSFHYDKPSSEAPQTFLLVLPTRLTGNWQWADLVDALHHTLDAARLRAVEPYQVDQTTYARYLPALLSPTTRHPITIGMYLADLPLTAVASE